MTKIITTTHCPRPSEIPDIPRTQELPLTNMIPAFWSFACGIQPQVWDQNWATRVGEEHFWVRKELGGLTGGEGVKRDEGRWEEPWRPLNNRCGRFSNRVCLNKKAAPITGDDGNCKYTLRLCWPSKWGISCPKDKTTSYLVRFGTWRVIPWKTRWAMK